MPPRRCAGRRNQGLAMEEEKFAALNRRDFLTMTSAAVGLGGMGLATVPFLKALGPTRDIIRAGVMEVDISGLKEGESRVVMWRKQPVFIVRRSREMVEQAKRIALSSLRDPAQPEERVQRPDLLVCLGICTHLGCIPSWHPEKVPGLDQPGFYCPCHGGKYDSLGRRLDGPPPENLHLLPYRFLNANKLRIGTEKFTGYSENIRKVQELPRA